jgi:hypothetical protein
MCTFIRKYTSAPLQINLGGEAGVDDVTATKRNNNNVRVVVNIKALLEQTSSSRAVGG